MFSFLMFVLFASCHKFILINKYIYVYNMCVCVYIYIYIYMYVCMYTPQLQDFRGWVRAPGCVSLLACTGLYSIWHGVIS